MSKLYELGYDDAASFDWSKVPAEYAHKVVASYEARAIETKSAYMLGFAKGAKEILAGSVAA
ncbi:hypothetical protein [Sporomusa paucivorans]|uniref:hypothetical protein n=1 Tax=Sporomusa paucivorans TaxID=2376 RepID=UPI00357165C9